MLSKKKQKKVVFGRIFNSALKMGDYVEFPSGKIVWKVTYLGSDSNGLRITSLNSSYVERWFWGKKYPFYKVTKEEVMRFLCLHNPEKLTRYFQGVDLRPFFKKYLREV